MLVGREHVERLREAAASRVLAGAGGRHQAEAPMAPRGGREGGPDAPVADRGAGDLPERPPVHRPLDRHPLALLGRHDHAGGEERAAGDVLEPHRPHLQGHAAGHGDEAPVARQRRAVGGLDAGAQVGRALHRELQREAAVGRRGGGGDRLPGVALEALDDHGDGRGRGDGARDRGAIAPVDAGGGLERGDVDSRRGRRGAREGGDRREAEAGREHQRASCDPHGPLPSACVDAPIRHPARIP